MALLDVDVVAGSDQTEGTDRGCGPGPRIVCFMKTPLQMVIFGPFRFIKMSSMLEFLQRGKGRHERIGSSSHCGGRVFIHSYFHPFTDGCDLLIHSSASRGTFRPGCDLFACQLHFTACLQLKRELLFAY